MPYNRTVSDRRGPVEVLTTAEDRSHKGDVNPRKRKELEVNYFYATPASTTIAHKSALNAGTYARIYYYEGEILRVDIRNNPSRTGFHRNS